MSRGTRIIALAVAALLVVPASPAAADDPYVVPDDATITIEGDGSGHGIGMSQYGAYGAAREGLKVGQILDFYYPGTRTGSTAGDVRVWISDDDDRDLVVLGRATMTFRKVATGRTFSSMTPRATRWRIKPNAQGANVVSYFADGWQQVKTIRGDVEFLAGVRPLALKTPDGVVRYRGALRFAEQLTVNVLPMEQYVRGVVPAEMSAASWPQHALRAQAVAARTYAAFERTQWTKRAYDLCDTAACQAYGGATAQYPTSDKAVKATAKDVLKRNGNLAFAMYSASNGGHTVDGGRPYLPAQPDPYEGRSSDYYGWTRTVTSAELEAEYGYDNLVSIAIEERDGLGRRGGRVLQVRVTAESGFTDTIRGEDFQADWGLPSTLFTITSVD